MPAPATAFPAALLAAFDFAGAASTSGRRSSGPTLTDALPTTQKDAFDDLLSAALAGASTAAATTQPVNNVPAPTSEPTALSGLTSQATSSPERATLLAAFTQSGRVGTNSTTLAESVGTAQLGAEYANAIPTLTAAATSEVETTATNSDIAADAVADVIPDTQTEITTTAIPVADVESAAPIVGPKPSQESSPADDSSIPPSVMPQSAELTPGASRSNIEPPAPADEVHVEPQRVTGAKPVASVQEAATAESADTQTEDVDSEAAEVDSSLSTDQSTEGLRPVSELEQGVQTVPQPETPATSMPAAIVAETSAVSDQNVAIGAASETTPSGTPLLSATENPRAIRGVKDTSSPDSSTVDVTSATDEMTAQLLEAASGARTWADDHPPADQNSTPGSDTDATAVTSLGSPSASVAAGPQNEPVVNGPSVVHQISNAVETWRDALQEQGTARFSAWLNPPNLGHVYVELTRSSEGITARLTASDDGVQSVLESQGSELRQALSDAGVSVTELDVSGRSAGDSGSQQQQQQPPPDRREELETVLWRGESPPRRSAAPTRSSGVDVRV